MNSSFQPHRAFIRFVTAMALLLTVAAALSQYGWGRRELDINVYRTARDIPSHSTGTPVWTNNPSFEKDVFTFVRLKYGRNPYKRTRGAGWMTDTPDSDLNLSFRLQQMTSMKVDPDGRFLKLTDKDLVDYPFLYIVEPGGLYFTEDEAAALRNHLLNGGFLMLDDFWGETEWDNMEEAMKTVFPDRGFVELSLDHPIYHCVFEIKSKGQVPNVQLGAESEFTGVTWERPDATVVHHRIITDDRGRIMVIATHNTDNGDGWEREGESDYYFHNFSEKISYPLAINILFYTMTH